jgi:hypothetical protein
VRLGRRDDECSVFDILTVSIFYPVESAITNVQIQSLNMHEQDVSNRFHAHGGNIGSSQEHEESAGGAGATTSVPPEYKIRSSLWSLHLRVFSLILY